MKIIVFSDSHGRDTNMCRALEMNLNRFDLCLHLGDGCREFEALAQQYPGIPFVCVNGNGEELSGEPRVTETVLEPGHCRIMLTHGHRYGVKYSTTNLEYTAIERDCDIVLYGHTHLPDNRYIPREGSKGLYIFNPGSISRPHIGCKPSYGSIDITAGGILTSHGYIM